MAMKINLREGDRVFYTENGESDWGKVQDVATVDFTDPLTDERVYAGSVLVDFHPSGGTCDWYRATDLSKL